MQQGTWTLLAGGRRTIPTFRFPEAGALAFSRAVRHSEWRSRDPGVERAFADMDASRIREVIEPAVTRLGEEGGWLETGEVESVLAAAGLALPPAACHRRSRARWRPRPRSAVRWCSRWWLLRRSTSPMSAVSCSTSKETEAVAEGFPTGLGVQSQTGGVLVQEMVGEVMKS